METEISGTYYTVMVVDGGPGTKMMLPIKPIKPTSTVNLSSLKANERPGHAALWLG